MKILSFKMYFWVHETGIYLNWRRHSAPVVDVTCCLNAYMNLTDVNVSDRFNLLKK